MEIVIVLISAGVLYNVNTASAIVTLFILLGVTKKLGAK